MSSLCPQGILLLSVGSKAVTTRIARESARARGLVLHASDRQPNVPARFEADAFVCFEDTQPDAWIEAVLEYCRRKSVGLLIPTRHRDLAPLAQAANRFAEGGIGLSLSSRAALEICLDKLATFRFLRGIGAPTPETAALQDLPKSPLTERFPLFAKHPAGAGSRGARLVRGPNELEELPGDWIVQTVSHGREYTVNLYLDRGGEPLCVVPHTRLAVQDGEVVQAQTRRLPQLEAEARRICRALPGAQGILNIQAAVDPATGQFEILDINPRIGGGFPLAHHAKACFLEWLCQEWIDGKQPLACDRWTENLLMLRYREAHFEIQPPQDT